MLEFQARQKLKKRIYSRSTLIALLVLTALAFKGTWNVYWKYQESEENLRKIQERAQVLRDRESTLTAQIAALDTEKGVESEIRKKFSVVKDGEQVIVLVDEEAKQSAPTATTTGFFGRMWGKIRDIF